jgi:hypothetical protein
MNVFQNLDREQASMYRWLRDTMDQQTLERLIRKPVWSAEGCLDNDTLSRDTLLREAYHQYTARSAGEKVVNAAKMRVGILSTSLGAALARYTEAVEECATFAESFGGPTFSDVNRDLENALADLTDEMRKLQS